MWNIGPLEIKGQVVLGPMAGITNKAYRCFVKPFGVAVSYTEMISDYGIIYNNKKTLRYLDIDKNERPTGIQIFGSNKKTLIEAVKRMQELTDNYDFIDVNLGCPMPKVIKTGAGSSWLRRPEQLFEMMQSLVSISDKPVTAKIRIGYDEDSINVLKIVELLQQAKVSMICIHTRTTKQIYGGQARHHLISGLGERMKVPLVISGDIFTIAQAKEALNITKASAVMVARGALGKPHFITQLNHYLNTNETLPSVNIKEQLEYLKQYADQLVKLKGEKAAIRELRGIGIHFLTGYPGTKPYKVKMTKMDAIEEFENLIQRIKEDYHY
jgi:tRNA-dihydrouridine synthase B